MKSFKNQFHNILDLVFISFIDNVFLTTPEYVLKKNSAAHRAIVLNFNYDEDCDLKNEVEYFYDFKNASYEIINSYLNSVEWNEVFDLDDFNTCVYVFDSILQDVIHKFIPYKRRRKFNVTPWMTQEIRSLRNAKNRAYQKYMNSGLLVDYSVFCDLNNTFMFLNLKAYNSHVFDIGCKLKSNPKCFWKYINQTRAQSSFPKLMYYEGSEVFF